MGYAKERGKLEKLLVTLSGITGYNEKSLAVLVDTHEKYSHTVRILKNKEPEAFTDQYTNELQSVKDARKTLKESETDEAKQESFTAYKDVIVNALQKTIDTAKAIL
jgi:N-acetyl-gamma-glutamylphosphate reductase